MDSCGNFVVAWYDRRGSQQRIFLQMYDSSGVKKGTNFALQQDVANSVEQKFDLDVNRAGLFAVVWVESRSSRGVYAQIYDAGGNPQGANILVTDDSLSYPEDPGVSVDDTLFVVTWTDQRDGNPNIYYQRYYHDKTTLDSNVIIHNPENSLQVSPDHAVALANLYTVWMDNRISGQGFDICANIILYRRGDANGDEEITILDVVYTINYMFKDGPAPDPIHMADVNCDDTIDITDIVYLINYLFLDGPTPC